MKKALLALVLLSSCGRTTIHEDGYYEPYGPCHERVYENNYYEDNHYNDRHHHH